MILYEANKIISQQSITDAKDSGANQVMVRKAEEAVGFFRAGMGGYYKSTMIL